MKEHHEQTADMIDKHLLVGWSHLIGPRVFHFKGLSSRRKMKKEPK